jgi:hypothetical protein
LPLKFLTGRWRDMEFLTKEQILGASDLEEKEVEVPEWGGKVLVRGLTGRQRDIFEKSLITGKGKNRDVNIENARAKLLTLCLVDPKTKAPIFTQSDIEALGKKSAKALNRVYDVATDLSGIGEEEIEELTKNSESIPSDSSTFS